MSSIDSSTLEKIAAELTSMSPEGRNLICQALPQLALPAAARDAACASQLVENRETHVAGFNYQSTYLKTDDLGVEPCISCGVEAEPNVEILTPDQNSEPPNFTWMQRGQLDRPAERAILIRANPRHWALTGALCLITGISVFAATNSWHTRRQAQQVEQTTASFGVREQPVQSASDQNSVESDSSTTFNQVTESDPLGAIAPPAALPAQIGAKNLSSQYKTPPVHAKVTQKKRTQRWRAHRTSRRNRRAYIPKNRRGSVRRYSRRADSVRTHIQSPAGF